MEQISILSILRIGDQYVFQIEAVEAGRGASRTIAIWAPDEATRRALQGEIAATVQLLNDLLEPGSSPPSERQEEVPDPWLSLGRRLYAQLLPPTVRAFLQQLPPQSPLILTTNDTSLPWELLHDGDHYLTLTHPLGRQLLLETPPRQGELRPSGRCTALLIGNPSGDLSEADAEVQALIQRIETLPDAKRPRALLRRRATREAVLRELASGQYTLIHYAGHAQIDPGKEEGAALILARGQRLTADEIAQHLSGQPLVFLNACASVQEAVESVDTSMDLAHLRGAQGLASGFIRGGAWGVVGTLWPVHDVDSRQLAEAFYQQALQGIPVGEALQQARLKIREARPADPIWAAFLLYGDPRGQLVASDRWARQHATALCARLTNLDSILSTLSVEAAAEFLDAWVALVTAEIGRYGGMVHGVAQEAILGAFGLAPGLAHDAERAVRAALTIQKELSRLHQRQLGLRDQPLAAAIGIHTGEALIRHPTADAHGKLTIVGDTVEHARWLAAQAEPGQVLASAEAIQPTRAQFAALPQSVEIEVGQPVTALRLRSGQAFRVLGPGGAPGYRTPFLGREAELATLRACWERAVQGRGQLVGIVGKAGIGKSRLLQAFHDWLEDKDVLWVEARCPTALPDAPFGVLSALIHAWFRIPSEADPATVPGQIEVALQQMNLSEAWSDVDSTEVASILSDVLGVETAQMATEKIEPRIRYGFLIRVFKKLLGRSARQKPLVVALDDMHCVDRSSLEIIDRLVEGIERLPVLLILAYRPQWTHDWVNQPNYHQITLDRLDNRTSRTLLDALLGAETAASEPGNAILARSDGNPFFLEELVRSLQAQGVIVPANGGWQVMEFPATMELPGTIQRTIAGRMDRLRPGARSLLQSAAVIGGPFTTPLLADVLGTPEAQAALDENLAELTRGDFVLERWPEGEFQFKHPLLQEVAYTGLSAVQRSRLHRRVGESLERAWPEPTGEQVEVLAHHFYRSVAPGGERLPGKLASAEIRPEEVERAADYLMRVGVSAHRRYANHEAVTAYQRAWELLERLPSPRRVQQLDCLEGLGEALNALSEFDDALENLERAFALLRKGRMSSEDRRRAADLARRIGRINGWKAEYSEALSWMEEGLQTLGIRDASEDQAIRALIHAHTGAVHYWQGRYEAAIACYRQGLALLEDTQHWAEMAECYNGLGVVYDTQGQGKQALEYYEKSLAIWKKLGDAYQIARVEDNIGTAYFYLGEWDKTLEYDHKGLTFWERIDDRDKIAAACVNLGYAYLNKGEWREAWEYSQRARDLCQEIGNWRNLAHAYINLGLLSKAQNDLDEALTNLEQAQAIIEEHDVEDLRTAVYQGLAEVELALGETTQAIDLAEHALSEAMKLDLRIEEGVIRRVLGTIHLQRGEESLAESSLKQSLALLEETGNRHELGRTLVGLTMLYHNTGQQEQAQACLDRAIEIFEDLKARPDLEEAQRLRSNWAQAHAP